MSTSNQLKNLAVSSTGFVFDPRTGATFTVNATGLAVLLALRDGASLDAIVRELEAQFEGTTRGAREDVLDFVQALRGHGLATPDLAASNPHEGA
jgi:PqqD family protein of HPr-rel-A system